MRGGLYSRVDDPEIMDGTLPSTFVDDTDHVHIQAARPINSYLEDADYARIQRWLDYYTGYHLESCGVVSLSNGPEAEHPGVLTVFDIDKCCLTDIDWQAQKYVTLSYVWGLAQPPRLIKDKEAAFRQPGAFNILQFPRAIRDAIEVAGRLGFRYFWFDSLCLVQDVVNELLLWIDRMHVIYERSALTIVAAHAPDASTGLPGVSVLRDSQRTLNTGNSHLTLAMEHHGTGDIQNSKWSTRGWTQSSFSEGDVSDLKPVSRTGSSTVNYWQNIERYINDEPSKERSARCKIFRIYFRSVTEYTFRDLSCVSDTLRAFAGLMERTISTTGSPMIQGLPVKVFPMALMFLVEGRAVLNGGRMPVRRKEGFPSWSWAGWEGNVFWTGLNGFILGYDYEITLRWLREANWIKWFVSDAKGYRPLRLETPQGISVAREMMESSELPLSEQEALDSMNASNHLEKVDNSNVPRLCFTTIMFTARATPAPGLCDTEDVYEDVLSWNIFNAEEQKCGAVALDMPNSHHSQSSPHNSITIQCLAISERWTFGTEVKDPMLSEGEATVKPQVARAERRDGQETPRNFNILVVEEVKRGVYERRGVGWAQSCAITASLPPGTRWSTIVLA